MKYYLIEPEVAGRFGEGTESDRSVSPPIISKLHYILDGWLGDDILETFPCFLTTEALKKNIESSDLSGYKFDEVKVSRSDQFEQFEVLYKKRKIPKFYWIKIIGNPMVDDFGISDGNDLIVSEKVLDILKIFNINNCIVEGI